MLVAGHVADRYDRRKIVRIYQSVSGLAAATLALGTAGGWMTRESLLAIVFVTGSARAFEQTTLTTLRALELLADVFYHHFLIADHLIDVDGSPSVSTAQQQHGIVAAERMADDGNRSSQLRRGGGVL